MTRKRRLYLVHSNKGQRKIYSSSGALLSTTDYDAMFTGLQETTSFPHPFQHRNKTRFRDGRDCGGAFRSQNTWCNPGERMVSISNFTAPGVAYRTYDGPIYAWARTHSPVTFNISPSSDSVLDGYGATAISRCLPTNPLSGMGQFLGEMKEIPRPSKLAELFGRMIDFRKHPGRKFKSYKQALKHGKAAADDYLNFQFGWVPFARDLRDFAKTVKDSEKLIAQYERDSGRNVRRRYRFPDVVVTEVEELPRSQAWGAPQLDTSLYNDRGYITKTTTTKTEVWFSGCFTYYLPKQELARKAALAKKLYGLSLDPDLVWNLAPWTWALDWVTNFGDVVNNVTRFAQDGLVMRYGYVMEKKTQTITYALRDLDLKKEGKVNLTQTYTTVSKRRRRATPFGFGLDPGSFNARQWSIVAALGISKAPRSLDF